MSEGLPPKYWEADIERSVFGEPSEKDRDVSGIHIFKLNEPVTKEDILFIDYVISTGDIMKDKHQQVGHRFYDVLKYLTAYFDQGVMMEGVVHRMVLSDGSLPNRSFVFYRKNLHMPSVRDMYMDFYNMRHQGFVDFDDMTDIYDTKEYRDFQKSMIKGFNQSFQKCVEGDMEKLIGG
jgi:hypothetical protein